jgi:predicted enzyme related to lactoylglutathione lyase
MLKHLESVVLFVHDVGAAARWYAEIFGAEVGWENPQYAFIRTPGPLLAFHPADAKCPGGTGGTTAYWEVDDLEQAVEFLTRRGARLYRGPRMTDFGAGAAMLIDPFGCTLGLNRASARSVARIDALGAADLNTGGEA